MRIARFGFSALAVLGLALGVVLSADPACAQKRVALVVGVNDYPKLKSAADPLRGQLAKAVADAETMGDALGSLGFDVEIGRNLDRTGFLTALDRMKRKIAPGDTAFVFFAGHGVAFRGSNLLLPSDIPPVDPEGEQLIRGLSVAETDIIDALRERGAGLIVLTLDACRNNPIEEFAREQARVQGRAFRSTTMRSVGLETRPTSGVFSIYSAGIGQKALDGLSADRGERNSVFTRVFARKLREPGRHLSDVMEDVKEEVAKLAATEIDFDTRQPHRQFPAFYNETLGGRIFLARREAVVEAAPATPPVPATPPAPAIAADEVFWLAIKESKLAALFEEFLNKFPTSARSPEARQRLDEMKRLAALPPPAAPPAPVIVAPPPPAPTAARTYRVLDNVSQGVLNMRAGAGTRHAIVAAIPAGASDLSVGRCRPADDGVGPPWCEVQWRGRAGWASSCCMVEVTAAAVRTFRVLDNVSQGVLNMRQGPGASYGIVVAIPAGAADVSVGSCRSTDDGGRTPWCEVAWRGHRGWASSCCMVDLRTGAYARADD